MSIPATNSGGWQPIALSAELGPGAIAPNTLVDANGQTREVVLWRDLDAVAHLWDDRCPHRGMRLSYGFVRNGNLTCLYHGFQYGADGQCRYIPAHPRMEPPATLCTTALALAESGGLLWANGYDTPQQSPSLEADNSLQAIRTLVIRRTTAVTRAALDRAIFDPLTTRAADRQLVGREGAWARWRDACGVHHEVSYAWHEPQTRLIEIEARCDSGSSRIRIGVQTLPGERTALHVQAAAEPEPAGLKHDVHAWLRLLRFHIENDSDGRGLLETLR
ncbi:MAG: Rieske 2Fe-2S domain-containing protein [Gammaproteobacteria bacterium]|nr:Rieske 2Fe-2S domain-containing protein [Gammaproteobacteria bacterium]